jgi:hypothetical protein
MAVHAITVPACVSCGKSAGVLTPLLDSEGHSLGLLCDACLPEGRGLVEVVFHAFGGMHGNEGHYFDPKPPYHVPHLESMARLRDVSAYIVKRNPDLARYLRARQQPPRTAG